MMKRTIISLMLLLTVYFAGAQNELRASDVNRMIDRSAEAQKELVKATAPMLNFLMKYENGNPTQADFDRMLNEMGIMDEVQNDRSGLTKEDAFRFVNAYIKADQGEAIEIDQDKKDKVMEFLVQLEQGKKDAEQVFNRFVNSGELNRVANEAINQIREVQTFLNISYDDFRKDVLKNNPDASEADIKKAYQKLQKQLGF